MKKRKFDWSDFDWFFLLTGIATILLGTALAKSKPAEWDLISLFSIIILTIALYSLQRVAHRLSTPTVVEETRLRTGRKYHKVIDYLPGLILLVIIFSCLYFLLKQEVLIGINLVWLSLIALFIFAQTSNLLKHSIQAIEWLLKSLVLSPLLLVLGMSVQAVGLSSLHYLLALPLFALSASSYIALEFPKYAKSQSDQKASLIARIGLESTVSLHRVLILLSYVSLLGFLYFSGGFRSYWSLMLVSVFSFAQMLLLHRLALGMKPHFALIKATAIMQTLSFIYLCLFNIIF